jgi:hypothetical protein
MGWNRSTCGTFKYPTVRPSIIPYTGSQHTDYSAVVKTHTLRFTMALGFAAVVDLHALRFTLKQGFDHGGEHMGSVANGNSVLAVIRVHDRMSEVCLVAF